MRNSSKKSDSDIALIGFILIIAGLIVLSGMLSSASRTDVYDGIFGPGTASGTRAVYSDVPADEEDSAVLEIRILDVGQGLCVLMSKNGRYAVYDGGGRSTSSYVVSYMKKLGIKEFDYMFASHYDEDHIGGLVGLLNTVPVRTLIGPDYAADTRTYNSFMKTAEDLGLCPDSPAVGTVYDFEGVSLTVVGPQRYTYADENNLSVMLRVSYGGFSCLLTGDAETESELDTVGAGVDISSVVLVAGHHGSASSSSKLFVAAVRPEFSIISCGLDNEYGHPASSTLETLLLCGSRIFRTDTQGEISMATDGKTYWFNKTPTADYSSGKISSVLSGMLSPDRS